MIAINQEAFLKLSTSEVARLVREAGPQVCVFPVNGTRRWFILENRTETKMPSLQDYMDTTTQKYIELYKLCFDHGIDTLLSPVFGSELLSRGDEYTKKIGIGGILRLATHPDFLSFYDQYQIRVYFYGSYRKQLEKTEFAYVSDLLDQTMKATKSNDRYRIFYGVFANDSIDDVAELSVKHFQKTGSIPSSRELIEQYYGEYVSPATIFIGFDKLSVFDYPLLNSGEEDLYFTVAPSPYLNNKQLCMILYDHIYSRRVDDVNYAQMSAQNLLEMRNFYITNLENTLGIGKVHDGIWYPIFPSLK